MATWLQALTCTVIVSIVLTSTSEAQTPASGQGINNGDFERGLANWTATGPAFQGQPVKADDLTTTVIQPVRLGGTYWRDLPMPIGQSGENLIRSARRGVGALISEPFWIQSTDAFFSLRVGGTRDSRRARVELQLAPGAVKDTASSGVSWVTIWSTTGGGVDLLHQEVFDVPSSARGRVARVAIIAESGGADGSIMVDAIAVSGQRPAQPRTPVWGIGDYHTHPMNFMAFGGIRGIRTIWGVAGGAYRDYELMPSLIERDMPPCGKKHGGGTFVAEVGINLAEGRFAPKGNHLQQLWELFRRGLRHKDAGAPQFEAHPSFRSGLHHQMHITQIHRAWEGGLRLMVAIAVHNRGLEYVMSPVEKGAVTTSSERAVLDAQVCGMRQLAALNHDWMDIAYSPDQARDIISRGKLAIVLGVEFDELGDLHGLDSLDQEIDYLWGLGIRQITPIHAIDNRLGGAAVFQPVYNTLNDLLNRPTFNMTAAEAGDLVSAPPVFFQVKIDNCDAATRPPGECVRYNIGRDAAVARAAIGFLGLNVPFPGDVNFSYPPLGTMNARGLSPDGAEYIRQLMRSGLLIGLEHMSEESVRDVYEIVRQDLIVRRVRGCDAQPLDPLDRLQDSCLDQAYPMEFSHAHFRRLSIQWEDRDVEKKKLSQGLRPSEYKVSDSDLDMVRRLGGFAGVFVGEDPIEIPSDVGLPFANDCGGSSKSFAASFLFALKRTNRATLGLATDFTAIETVAPRFGKYACWKDRPVKNDDDKPPSSPVPGQYETGAQTNRVLYRSAKHPDALVPSTMGRRTFDFNEDGLAHYGLLPDLLEDLKNIGFPENGFTAIFNSAETYLRAWQKAEELSGRKLDKFAPIPLPCEQACRGLCPLSPNAGAPKRR